MTHARLRTAYTLRYRLLDTAVCGIEPLDRNHLSDNLPSGGPVDCPKCRHAIDVLGYKHHKEPAPC